MMMVNSTGVQARERATGRTASPPRRGLFSLALVSVSLIATIGACEIGLRAYHLLMARWRSAAVQEIVLDEKLGWRATENFRFTGELRDRDGAPYRAEVLTDARGFRVFGQVDSVSRAKILFVGDSFTHAVQVSAHDTFYSLVGRALECEVFAYGVGGWGTLQELMVLPAQLDLITPDAVVLQLCSNDIYNNHFELERGSAWNNNGLVRPYWEDGTIVHRLPRRWATLRRFANDHSEFLYFLFSRFDRIAAAGDRRGFEDQVREAGLRFAPFADAATVTAQLLRQFRGTTPSEVPVFAFLTDDPAQEYAVLRSSSEEAELVFIDGVPEALRQAESNGVCTRAADGGHWSLAGHRTVAGVLTEFLEPEWSTSRGISTDQASATVLRPSALSAGPARAREAPP